MDELEFMWFVGLFEGEGCIAWSDKRRLGKIAAHITIGSTDRDVIDRVQSFLGGNVYTGKGTNKPMHYWRIGNRKRVVELLTRMYPHMSKRRQDRIDEVLPELISFVDTRYGNDVVCKNGHVRTDSNTRTHKTYRHKVCLDCRRKSHTDRNI